MRKNQIACFEILSEFIKKSKHAIFASAFITQKTIDYVNSFNIHAACIFNKTIPNESQPYDIFRNVGFALKSMIHYLMYFLKKKLHNSFHFFECFLLIL